MPLSRQEQQQQPKPTVELTRVPQETAVTPYCNIPSKPHAVDCRERERYTMRVQESTAATRPKCTHCLHGSWCRFRESGLEYRSSPGCLYILFWLDFGLFFLFDSHRVPGLYLRYGVCCPGFLQTSLHSVDAYSVLDYSCAFFLSFHCRTSSSVFLRYGCPNPPPPLPFSGESVIQRFNMAFASSNG